MITRRGFLSASAASLGAASKRPPNVILILADNLGYGDLGCYGNTRFRTPHVDRMAKEGIRFTSFYASSGVCTPSRASIMTGCYPRRVGLHLTDPDGMVIRPVSRNGLHPDETTIAEVLKSRGYATSIIGKWHLGDQPAFLPTRQGFDSYFGIPYSDDMTGGKQPGWPPIPLMENETVIEAPVDRDLLTRRYTEKAIEMIRRNRERPFFLYLPHAMPGSTAAPFASPEFRGKSAHGAWGDAIEEMDWSTGRIMSTLQELGIDDNTLVIWTSDNGAPRHNGKLGSNLPLSGWGYTTAEGGQRIPCIARWPGHIAPGQTCDAIGTLMDWLPTAAKLVGAKLPSRPIDGKDLGPLLAGRTKRSPHEAFYYYYGPQLQAVRAGKWKLVLPLEKRWMTLRGATERGEMRLYDLDADLAESRDVAAASPDVVRRLTALAEKARQDLGDVDRRGRGERPAGRVENPTPRLLQNRNVSA